MLSSIIFSFLLKLTVARDEQWTVVQRCELTGKVIPVKGILFNRETAVCWIVGDDTSDNGYKLWQIHQFINDDSKEGIQSGKPYMLGAEDFGEVMHSKHSEKVNLCRENDQIIMHYAFDYPHDHGLILRDLMKDEKKNIYYKNCTDSNKSEPDANQVPQYKIRGEKTIKSLNQHSFTTNQTFELFMNENVIYRFFGGDVYHIQQLSIGKVTELYRVVALKNCKRENVRVHYYTDTTTLIMELEEPSSTPSGSQNIILNYSLSFHCLFILWYISYRFINWENF